MRVSISDYIGNLTCHFVTCISHEILYCCLQYVCIFNYIFRLIYMRILAFCLNDIKEEDLMLTPNHTHTHTEKHIYTQRHCTFLRMEASLFLILRKASTHQ